MLTRIIVVQVTFAMCLIGAVPWFRGLLLLLAQMAGGMAAAGVIDAILPGTLMVPTVLSPSISTAQGQRQVPSKKPVQSC